MRKKITKKRRIKLLKKQVRRAVDAVLLEARRGDAEHKRMAAEYLADAQRRLKWVTGR